MRIPKVVVVGAGMVGGSASLLISAGVPGCEVVIVDVDASRAEGQAIDIAHAGALWRAVHIRAGTFDDAADANIVVIAAGAAMKPGETRLDLARTNVGILRSILSEIGDRAPDAIYVLATNPVDVLAYMARQILDLPPRRVISTGTSLDSARLRTMLGERLDVVPTAVHAYVLGEHGDSSFIHWSGASVSGMPLDYYLEASGNKMGEATRATLAFAVRDAAHLIKEGKEVSHYGIASAIARICQAILHDSQIILPVATVHAEIEDVADVCLSLPSVIGAEGARVVSYPLLSDDERRDLAASAGIVKQAQEEAAALAAAGNS